VSAPKEKKNVELRSRALCPPLGGEKGVRSDIPKIGARSGKKGDTPGKN